MEGRHFSVFLLILQHGYISANLSPEILRTVSSTEDFLHRFVKMPDGSPVNVSGIQPGFGNTDAMHINGDSVSLASYDRCEPRYVTVIINTDDNMETESNVVLWPPCTRIERCSGCCAQDSLMCEPIETEMVSLQVVRYVMPNIGAPEFQFGGFKTVQVERHLKCDQRCRIKAQHCNPHIHDYLERDCRCRCKQAPQSCASSKHVWRENKCRCECNHREECSGFARFDESTCQCDLRQVINGHLSEEERDQLRQMLSNGGSSNNNAMAAPTTTTTTTTTPAPVRQGGCPLMNCLPGWSPKRFSNGVCNCMPTGFGFPGRRRRRGTFNRR